MVHCDHCGKVFKYNCHLLRHLSSKTPCYSKTPPEFVNIDSDNNVHENENNVREDGARNVREKDRNVRIENDKYKGECSKCGKVLSSKSFLKKHEAKCNGLHSLQCPTCHKFFATRSSKYNHIKTVKCKPPENTEQFCRPVNGGTVHITNNHNNINIDNSINNDNRTLNNNHIYLVNFSDTDYSHVSIEKIVRMVSKCEASPSRFFNMMITEAHKNEYANVGLSNIKGNYATIYDEQQFLKVSADEIAEEIGKKIVYRMDECRSDKENKDILKQGNIYRRVYSYSWLENVVDHTPADEYDEETSDALRTLNMRKRDAVDKINQSIRFGLHNVHNNMKEIKGKMNTT